MKTQSRLQVGILSGDKDMLISVHLKQGEHTTVLYCEKHPVGYDTGGSVPLPDELFATPPEPASRGTLEDALYVRYLLRNCLVVLARSNAKSMAQEVREYLQTPMQAEHIAGRKLPTIEGKTGQIRVFNGTSAEWQDPPAPKNETDFLLSSPANAAHLEASIGQLGATKSPDANVEKNRELLLQRSIVGLAKYGLTTADNPIPHKEWLQHALEESLDMANYLQAAINRPEPDAASIRKAALEEAVQACESVPLGHGDYTIMCEVVEAIRALINKEGNQ